MRIITHSSTLAYARLNWSKSSHNLLILYIKEYIVNFAGHYFKAEIKAPTERDKAPADLATARLGLPQLTVCLEAQ